MGLISVMFSCSVVCLNQKAVQAKMFPITGVPTPSPGDPTLHFKPFLISLANY